MKFKVGDKVRIKKDLGINRTYGNLMLETGMARLRGKETTIIETTDALNYLCDNGWIWSEEMLEPIMGGKYMKKYSTSEAIAMLEKNPKEAFTAECDEYIYKFRVSGKYFYFEVFYGNKLVDRTLGSGGFNGNIPIDLKWELVQRPVSFMEAVKAYSEGKAIRCELNDTMTTTYSNNCSLGGKFVGTNRSLLTTSEILNGKWYIEVEV